MNDNVKVLFPDRPSAADVPNPAEMLAETLERFAAQLRSGEVVAQYGALIYVDHETRVHGLAVGDSTELQHVAMLAVAQAMVVQAVTT